MKFLGFIIIKLLLWLFLLTIYTLPDWILEILTDVPFEIKSSIHVLLTVVILVFLWWYMRKEVNLAKAEVASLRLSTQFIWFAGIAWIILGYCLPSSIMDTANQIQISKEVIEHPVFMFFQTVIFASISEELLLRVLPHKLFFMDFSKKWILLLYIVLTSAIFASLHIPANLYQFLIYFVPGVLLTLLYASSRDIRQSILLHMLNNFINYLFILL